jgi:DUF438 domain-containing protein
MSKDMNSFDKLREIESELDSLKDYKKQVTNNEPYKKPTIDINRMLLESITKSCIQMELELSQVSSSIKELVRLFRAAMEGKSPEELEENKEEDKMRRLMEQNEALLRKLNTLTMTMGMNNNYDSSNILGRNSMLGNDYLRRTLL